MADRFSQPKMHLVEDYLLENIGTFIHHVTGLDIFLLNQPWPAQISPSVGVEIMDYDDSGGWSNTNCIEDGRSVAVIDLRFTVMIMARSGRPMATLAELIQAFRGYKELRFQDLYSKGIGLLDISNATPANTVYDGDETEKRARMTATFNARIKSLDITAPNLIEKINGTIFTNEVAADFEYPADHLYQFFNADSVEGDTEEQKLLAKGLRPSLINTFNVDITTT